MAGAWDQEALGRTKPQLPPQGMSKVGRWPRPRGVKPGGPDKQEALTRDAHREEDAERAEPSHLRVAGDLPDEGWMWSRSHFQI